MNSQFILHVDNVSKSFQGLKAVQNVSFRITQGEILGLIGPNGAGKTTLFNLLSGVLLPDEGDISFMGYSLLGLKPHEIAGLGIGRTFQIVKPFKELTVFENVLIGALQKNKHLPKAQRLSRDILELLGLTPKKDLLAQHLTLPERKCLEVARALATEPQLILLDEVMAGLRPHEVDEMVQTLKDLNKTHHLSMIVIEHVMRAVMALSDHILVLNYGEKIAEGPPETVTKHPKVLECYLGEGEL